MKKTFPLFILAFIIAFASCKKDRNEVQPVSLSMNVEFDGSVQSYGFPLTGATVTLTNLTNGTVNTATATQSGDINFSSIAPGNYDIQAVLTVPAATYNELTGLTSPGDVVFNASLKSYSLVVNTSQLKLTLKTGIIGGWVFKQIYYAGSNTSKGASFRDQFIEIYNNSNETLYADSLYISQVYGDNTKLTAVDLTKGFNLASTKQFDWTKAIGMNNSNANEGYIYAKTLFMIPGNGKSYPVEPGQSLIIAATALNHKSPYVGTDGKSVDVKDPSLTIDLSAADFEVYLGDYPGINPLGSDIDNPLVTNVKAVVRANNRDLILDALGRDAYVIFKSQNMGSYGKYPSPDEKVVNTDTDLYTQIPVSVILDGVELQTPVSANAVPKKLGATVDAGSKSVSKGQYTSQSLLRKTAKTVGGRVILTDTNNSTNDFTELDLPDVTKTVFKQ